MVDRDLAELYGVTTKRLNEQVKRNRKRFPEDFMFRLTMAEWRSVQSSSKSAPGEYTLRSQSVTLEGKGKHSKYLPFAFTEQGIAMLSGVLHSDRAIRMNIAIMRAFVESRRLSLQELDVITQLKEIKGALGVHDNQLIQLYDAIESLLNEKTAQIKWEDRERIGFKK